MAIGRISGPLLKDNLLRNGVNLAFETNLLYLDVVNGRIGINTASPTNDLSVNGTTRTTNLYATTQANIGTFTITGSTISSTNNTITLSPAGVNPVVYQGTISVGNLSISGSTVSATGTNTSINITASGTGSINLNNSVLVSGNLHATGNITADGNITLGNASTDTVTFDAEIASSIIPNTNNAYNLGSSSLKWANLYVTTVSTTSLTSATLTASSTLTVDGISTLSGDTTIGTTSANTLNIISTINSNVVPNATNTYNLGSSSYYWNNGYIKTINTAGLQATGNSISATGTNANLQLSANGTGTVYVPTSNLAITNNAAIGGTLGVSGTSTLAAVGITGTLTQTGDFNQTGNFSTSGTASATGNITGGAQLILPQVTINNSSITGTATNANLSITANGTGNVTFPNNNVSVTNNVTVGGTLGVSGTSTLAAVGITGTLTQTGDFNQTGNFSTSGTASVTGNITGGAQLILPQVTINNSSISGTATNTNLVLAANGTGKVSFPNNNVSVTNNVTVGGTLGVTGTSTLAGVGITGTLTQTGDFNQTGNFGTSGTLTVTGNITGSGTFSVPNITISGNTITTNTGNLDLYLLANGTGSVFAQSIKFTNNNIQSSGSYANIMLTPQATGNVVINNTQSLVMPVGTALQRPSPASNGMVRYNSDVNRYEGYANGYWTNLGGVQSVDGKTRILPESAPGAGNNVIYFYANDNLTATIDSTKLYAVDFQTSAIDITANTISAISSNTDINFTTSGTGGVVIGNLKFTGNTITNTVANAITVFNETSAGYVKISGTYGVVIPWGSTSQRPSLQYEETGMMRYNTDLSYVEIFDGVVWKNAAGSSTGVTSASAQDIGVQTALAIG